MVHEPGRVGRSYTAMLGGSRGWKDLYKVPEYFPQTKDHAYKQYNQLVSDRHLAEANPGTEYDRYLSLLRLPGPEGPISREYDRESCSTGCFEGTADSE